MNDEKKRELKKRMDALLEKYCRQLPDKYIEIEASWNDYRADLTNPTHIETFYRLIHTLKGTAATFGFKTQGDICFNIQKLLMEVNETKAALKQDDVKKIQTYLDELKENINTPAEEIVH